jgi:hypothetical protein
MDFLCSYVTLTYEKALLLELQKSGRVFFFFAEKARTTLPIFSVENKDDV